LREGGARRADRLGYTHRNIVSGAGHDACWINRVAPTAMVMCPCVDGLSHNEAEEISKEWAAAGCDVLFHAVVETAGIESHQERHHRHRRPHLEGRRLHQARQDRGDRAGPAWRS
jgi:hypothetical protein